MAMRTLPVALIAISAACATVSADVVTYVVGGEITRRNQRDSDFPAALASVNVGDTFELRVTLDTGAAADSDPDPTFATYDMPAGSYSAQLRLGSAMGTLPAGVPLTAHAADDFIGLIDGVELILGSDSSDGFFGPSSVDANTVFPITALSSDALPTSDIGESPTSTANFTYRSFLNFPAGDLTALPSELGGVITSFQVVPAPGMLAPLTLVGAAAGLRRRR